MGFDRVIVHAFHPVENLLFGDQPPPLEGIYPKGKSCVKNWDTLGYIKWIPHVVNETLGYGVTLDSYKKVELKKTYESLRSEFDWVLISTSRY